MNSAYDFTIKQSDNVPSLTQTITDSTGAPVDLTNCSVSFVLRTLTSATPLINAPAAIVDATAGKVAFNFTTSQTSVAGQFMATWQIHNGTNIFSVPTTGYLSVLISESLSTSGGQMLASVAEVKEALNIPSDDHTHDDRLATLINSLTPVIEHITGPILQRSVTEYYDGGEETIILRTRPALSINAVSEWWGPVEHVLTQVSNPTLGTIYSYMVEPNGNRITRRGPGGSTMNFQLGNQVIQVQYTAGMATVGSNITEAVKQLCRIHYDESQARPLGRSWLTNSAYSDSEPTNGSSVLGFYVPNSVRELLAPSRKAPAFF